MIELKYDVVVIGGGIAGVCAAIAAARCGAKTALVQDRPVLGGNASSEVRMHIVGATRHGARKNLRETGIIEEILLENKHRNPEHSYAIFDTILWEKTNFQENLDLYLNTYVSSVQMQGNSILSVKAHQTTSEKEFCFFAYQFIDCSGDGLVSSLSGAEYMFGREAKEAFNEPNAVCKADTVTMGNSIQFRALDAGRPVPFKRPSFAYDYSNAEWPNRIKWAEITSGYWWLEVGGTEWNVVSDAEKTRDEMLKIIYGIWDYIKNYSEKRKEAENLYIDWVSFIPAKRESRRIVGDYVLNERDILENRLFDDAVAYGGWHLDSHRPEGFYAFINELPQNEDKATLFDGIYTIPYRALYAKDTENLFLGGRLISASHRAFSSTRVMATCAVAAEAVGTAAAMAVSRKIKPREIGGYIKDLQQLLLRNGCYIPNCSNEDEKDLALQSKVTATSHLCGFEPQKVINGIARPVGDECNMWQSEEIVNEQSITLAWQKPIKPSQIILTFDSDLTAEIMPSLSKWHHVRQSYSVPETIVKDYRVVCLLKGKMVAEKAVTENYQRCNIIQNDAVCDEIKIAISATNGCPMARICEIRVYE